jgi:hypothetical protein
MKLAATEDVPTIRAYDEKLWSETEDARTAPVGLSLDFIDALHSRWTWWLRSLPQDAFGRRLQHPEAGAMDLDALLELYSWHGRHHLAHITNLAAQNKW